ncbi:hypothetical protein H8A97_24520 [Bradyrhizobium sp. Arg62]|uniref:hypothetical protein n=1 Tax=Bradyrhizobium brasilense TaxID=1419277 RepID=UPI001E35B389|nr:hypothetical protein [Bradyrhizobium brasilense]MCC8948188.1 hypothetical protein [Bradyrhizobium brasilense]
MLLTVVWRGSALKCRDVKLVTRTGEEAKIAGSQNDQYPTHHLDRGQIFNQTVEDDPGFWSSGLDGADAIPFL